MTQPHHPLYIVASPRPRVGKTLLARLLIEFFYASDRALIGYDLNPREPALAGRFPHLVWPVDITETLGQMELFDRLIADNSRTQIVDLGYAPFAQFFGVLNEIGFVPEARRRFIEPIVLFVPTRRRPPSASMRSCGTGCRERRSSRCTTSWFRSCSRKRISRRRAANAA
jgi:hypothetical protein